MGKPLIELFKKGDINTFNVQDGNVAAPGGKTMQERYDIKNSKDVPLSSSSPLMGLSFFALNKVRIASNERKKETFLEEELIGLRTLRGLSSITLYGSDILRLKLESTPMVEKMKQSANGSDSSKLSKFGQQLKQTRDEVNNFLKIPTPLNPTEYYKKLQGKTAEQPAEIPVYDTMEKLSEIKNAANGSLLGKILKDSAGGGSSIGKQVIGASLSNAKSALRKKIIGANATSKNGNNDFERSIFLFSQIEGENYSQLAIGGNKTGKANADTELTDWSIRSRYDGISIDNPKFPLITNKNGTGWNSQNWYISKTENFFTNDPYEKRNGLFMQIFNPDKVSTSGQITQVYSYTKNSNSPNSRINNASSIFETQNYSTAKLKNDNIIVKPGGGNQKTINVNDLRPTNLKDVKNKNDAPSYSKSKGMRSIGESSIYGNLEETLEKSRGLGSNRDVLNQTGIFTQAQLSSVKYNNIGIEEVDLIPLRFQKLNDNTAVYFRATISGYSETFTPDWEGHKFLGNPFNFYSYKGVERKLSFSLKVYAMSQPELVMMWSRLEYLAHMTYPYSYAGSGFTPTLLYFTLGSVHVNKPAIITSLTYTIDDNEQLWELGGDAGKIGKDRYEFSGQFPAGKSNKTIISKNSNIQNYKSSFTKYKISQDGKMVEVDTFKNNSNKPTDTTDFIIETEKINADMSQYKLPKFINAQIELTFLESQTNTSDNLYGYGNPITSGV
jgi:hypothetical protein